MAGNLTLTPFLLSRWATIIRFADEGDISYEPWTIGATLTFWN